MLCDISYPLTLINAHTDPHGKPYQVEESQCVWTVQAVLQRDNNHCVGAITCHMHIDSGTLRPLSAHVTHKRDSTVTNKIKQREQKKPCDRTIDSVGKVSLGAKGRDREWECMRQESQQPGTKPVKNSTVQCDDCFIKPETADWIIMGTNRGVKE